MIERVVEVVSSFEVADRDDRGSGGRNRQPIALLMHCSYGGSTMEPIEFPSDFIEFLKLLSANVVEYLLVGGFAVAIHGHPTCDSRYRCLGCT